jgi:very-short-patch-repair endonuclease
VANDFARRLRRELTGPEKFFSKNVRNRRFDGHKIRRQVPIGSYVADFACFEKRVVFEIDGQSHLETGEYDHHRSQWLIDNGWRVVRFLNEEVSQEWNAVEEAVWNALNGAVVSKIPSPLVGEGRERSEPGEGAERLEHPSPLTPLPQGERGIRPSGESRSQ